MKLWAGKKHYILKSYGVGDKSEYQWDFWLENEEGEGMSVSTKNLYDMLDKYFKDNF